jgi:hypothetical protein
MQWSIRSGLFWFGFNFVATSVGKDEDVVVIGIKVDARV